MARIIQFIHPGGEHNAKTGVNWNTSSHKRKFLKVKGSYLNNIDSQTPIEDTIYFWGEWEAQSFIEKTNQSSPLPKYIFSPHYTLPMPAKPDNTDPFVFGEQFYYCICKQGHYHSLRELKGGDIILFGSNLNEHFVLDTLLVIKDKKEYTISNIDSLKENYNQVFYDVALAPLKHIAETSCKNIITEVKDGCEIHYCAKNDNDSNPAKGVSKYQIYSSVMQADCDKNNSIFSYSPCMVAKNQLKGFARPIIKLPNVISQDLKQGIKIIDTDDAVKFWHAVTKQVIDNGLSLMIKNNSPQNLSNNY